MPYEKELKLAMEAALEAGELLRTEFHRAGGPRGFKDHADADTEAEWLIRKRLVEGFPAYRYRGEETGSIHKESDHVWLVDPNDGTSSFLRGARGSAVSIGLVWQGVPVLGVVFAFAAPDDAGDLICWAEGEPLLRNGKVVQTAWDLSNPNHVLVLVSTHREHVMEPLLECIQPFRYRAFPSIAYRLALVAVGDGCAAMSWHNPGDWDYAGGHALLRAAGGVLLNETGEPVTYAADGASKVKRCFGGQPDLVRDLWPRDWEPVQKQFFRPPDPKTKVSSPFLFARLKPGSSISDAGLLSRAHGCLLGQVAGDSLGALVEFQTPAKIRAQYPTGLPELKDGGQWDLMAGQPTDDSELALLLARSIVQEGHYDREKVAVAYRYWYHESRPFDVGNTTAQAMSGISDMNVQIGRTAEAMTNQSSKQSQANGSLMRISPLAIYGYDLSAQDLWILAGKESELTHPHAVCQQCCGLYCIAISRALKHGETGSQIYNFVLEFASSTGVDETVANALRAAASSKPDALNHSGWVLVAFQNAFYQLLHSNTFVDGVRDTVLLGGDTDTNAAIAGALLGAVYGRPSIPDSWRHLILSCRPTKVAGAVRPRPWCFWPVDAMNLAELLLLS